METIGTPKYCPLPRYHHHSLSAYFGMDVWWSPDETRQGASRCRSAWSCGYLPVVLDLTLTLTISYLMSLAAFTISIPVT